ncbi:MAG: hypothetical protein ACYTGQ_19540 [Planctomycetota bacterium]
MKFRFEPIVLLLFKQGKKEGVDASKNLHPFSDRLGGSFGGLRKEIAVE